MNDPSRSSEHEHYLSMTASYDSRIDAILPMSDHFFSTCLSFIPDGQITLLELGSGTGYATSKIVEAHPRAAITSIDHSPDMIRCATAKPELASVQIFEMDIRDPWPESRYDVIMTTLCLHHIPGDDRIRLLHRIHDALSSDGVFICGDIIRPETMGEEEIYLGRWIRSMMMAGLSPDQIDQITASRRANYRDMETIGSFSRKMKETGFSQILLPYKHEISAVFIGFR